MISMLRGSLVLKDFEGVVIDVGGVGYRVGVPMTSLEQLPPAGQEALLYTILVVREDAMSLFGFASPGDRAVFERLVTVSGVGPKVALALMSGLTGREVVQAIVGGDVTTLLSAKGVGKKLAERLILELKDVIVKIDLGGGQVAGAPPSSPSQKLEHNLEDLRSALQNLGYQPKSIDKALEVVREEAPGADFDAMLRAALKFMRAR
jgi:Holliday junction DNA helicase RuvA